MNNLIIMNDMTKHDDLARELEGIITKYEHDNGTHIQLKFREYNNSLEYIIKSFYDKKIKITLDINNEFLYMKNGTLIYKDVDTSYNINDEIEIKSITLDKLLLLNGCHSSMNDIMNKMFGDYNRQIYLSEKDNSVLLKFKMIVGLPMTDCVYIGTYKFV